MTYIDNYIKWIKDNTVEEQLSDGWTEIATPFMDRHNDGLVIYAKEDRGEILLSDDGYIIGDMEVSGVSVGRRMKSIVQFLRSYGVEVNDNKELQVKANKHYYPVKQHLMLQAMMAASDMFVPTKHGNGSNIFLDDVSKFFDDNDIFPTPNAQFTGKSGYVHNVDFVIPRTRKHPERFVYAINTPNASIVMSAIFRWNDIRQARDNTTTMLALLNDAKKVPDDAITAFSNYTAKPIRWSDREKSIDDFKIA